MVQLIFSKNKPIILVIALILCPALLIAGCQPETLSGLPAATPGIVSSDTAEPFFSGIVMRDVIYPSTGNARLKMDIYLPETTPASVPVVLFVHGGGWILGDKTEGTGIDEIPALLDAGIAVAAVNYRLAPEFKFPAMIEDIKSAVRFLRSKASYYGFNPERIGAYGASAGGHLVALLGAADESAGWDDGPNGEYSSRVQAVIDMFGPTDLTLLFPTGNTDFLYQTFGTHDFESSIVANANPITWVTPDDPPFLILHGDRDLLVAPAHSQVLYDALTGAGIDAELVMVKNAGHGWRNNPNMEPDKEEITEKIVRFFKKHLQ